MEKSEEMIILKSDCAIVVKKDGTALKQLEKERRNEE